MLNVKTLELIQDALDTYSIRMAKTASQRRSEARLGQGSPLGEALDKLARDADSASREVGAIIATVAQGCPFTIPGAPKPLPAAA